MSLDNVTCSHKEGKTEEVVNVEAELSDGGRGIDSESWERCGDGVRDGA